MGKGRMERARVGKGTEGEGREEEGKGEGREMEMMGKFASLALVERCPCVQDVFVM